MKCRCGLICTEWLRGSYASTQADLHTMIEPQYDLDSRNAPPWLAIARMETGVAQYPAGQSNSRITEYQEHTNIRGYDDKASWCSSFVNWCLAQLDIAGTGSARARSQPALGCIAVLYRDEPDSWKGHVGFFLRADSESVYLLGGNQLGRVCENAYPRESVLGYRWPALMTRKDSIYGRV
jgi:uncharacterized protein (TIGR02594 family)